MASIQLLFSHVNVTHVAHSSRVSLVTGYYPANGLFVDTDCFPCQQAFALPSGEFRSDSELQSAGDNAHVFRVPQS